MANKIQLKRGLKANLPTLNIGELAYCTDTKELFIGDNTGNKLLNGGVSDFNSLTNKPYISLVGTLETPIDLDSMYNVTEGAAPVIYNVSGFYTSASEGYLADIGANGMFPATVILVYPSGAGYVMQYTIIIGMAVVVRMYQNSTWTTGFQQEPLYSNDPSVDPSYEPANSNDLATKGYVDSHTSSPPNLTLTTLTLGNFTISYNSTTNTLDFEASA